MSERTYVDSVGREQENGDWDDGGAVVTRAKEQLDAATPLPWRSGAGAVYDDNGAIADTDIRPSHASANAYLIQYAVNRLPDYEAAVEALEALLDVPFSRFGAVERDEARAALARLRDEVPA